MKLKERFDEASLRSIPYDQIPEVIGQLEKVRVILLERLRTESPEKIDFSKPEGAVRDLLDLVARILAEEWVFGPPAKNDQKKGQRKQNHKTPTTGLLDEKQAAEMLTVAVKTLQRWRWNGRGPRFVKVGRLVRYDVADLREFVKVRSRTSDSGS